MSERREQAVKNVNSWEQVDKETPSPQVIEAIYNSIWTERKPAAGAMLTNMERLEYARQSSAGLPQKNSDCAGQPQTGCELDKRKKDFVDDIWTHKVDGDFNSLPQRATRHAMRGLEQPHRSPDLLAEKKSHLNDSYDPYCELSRSRCPNYYDYSKHGYGPLDQLKDLNRRDDRMHMPQADKLENRTQKVCYPDGSSRVVLRNQKGEITLVVNPDGSRLEREEGEKGKAPEWKAYGRHGTPIVADSFRGHVAMSQDGTFQMVQIYPVPQMYEQKPDGSYRHAYRGGAAEQWTASKQTDTILYPDGKAREIRFANNSKGILQKTSVTDRSA